MALSHPNPPVKTKAIPAKEFNELWLPSITIKAPSITTGQITIETIPFNEDEQELGSGKDMVAIKTDELWLAVNEVPEVAAAMGAIFAAVGPLRTWVAARALILAEEE
jgi:hypothetical protein